MAATTAMKQGTMSEITTQADRDEASGRFLPGNSGNGGRKKGARSKLGEAFLEDLRDAWNEFGTTALQRCAIEHPEKFCKIVADLMPKTIDLNVAVDVTQFATTFRAAREMLGNPEPPPLVRKSLRTIAPRTIEHDDAG
jgi:hypothetical protein